jgi:putative hydrolase of the HAD superfamily
VAEPEIDVVLFDLGGVLIEFGGFEAMRVLSGIDDDDEMWRRWLTCRWVREFERGRCTADAFATGFVDEWSLEITPAEFLDEFATWPAGVFAGADELVAEVRGRLPTGCLSNTNSIHWDQNSGRWPLLTSFDFHFLSHELGVLKPDRDVFDRVAAQLPAPPERVLFLDDNDLNVDGAIDAGFRAARVRGVAEARAALVGAHVLGC